MRRYLIGISIVVAMASVAMPLHSQSLGIGAGSQGSQNYAVNGAIAKLLSDKANFDVRVQSYGGSGASLPLLDTGRLDLQAIVSPEVYSAVLGTVPFEGRPMKSLRVVASLGPSTYGFFVRKDSPYQTVADIKDKKITYGFTAQPTLKAQVDGILANGGLDITKMQPVMVPSVPRGVDDFIAGKADVAFFAFHGGKVQEADAAVGIRWLALSPDKNAEAAMQKHVPGSYVQTVAPGPKSLGIAKPTPMMAYDYLLVTSAGVSDDVIYKIAKTLGDNASEVSKLHPTLSDFDRASMAPKLGELAYHPGALRYYREAGLLPPK